MVSPRPLLPPLFLLQASSPGALRRALLDLGAAPDRVDLGYVGEHDCYVLGGRGPEPSGEPARVATGGGDGAGGGRAWSPPALWVDQESLEAVRIVRGDGVRFELGPPVERGGATLPAWVEVRSPGSAPLRLEIRTARPAEPGPRSFSPAWLAPPAPPEPGASPSPAGARR